MKRGSIVWVNLEDVTPPEMGKTRPGVIISNTEQNNVLDTVVILPLSSKSPEIWPLRLKLKLSKGKENFAIIPAIRQVSKSRLLNYIGNAPSDFLHEVDKALRLYLAD
jgi:mRNA interferase MazF